MFLRSAPRLSSLLKALARPAVGVGRSWRGGSRGPVSEVFSVIAAGLSEEVVSRFVDIGKRARVFGAVTMKVGVKASGEILARVSDLGLARVHGNSQDKVWVRAAENGRETGRV